MFVEQEFDVHVDRLITLVALGESTRLVPCRKRSPRRREFVGPSVLDGRSNTPAQREHRPEKSWGRERRFHLGLIPLRSKGKSITNPRASSAAFSG